MQTRSAKLAVIALRKHFEDALAGMVGALDETDPTYAIHEAWAITAAAKDAIAYLPLLDSRQGCSEYIACVAWLCSNNHIDKDQTKTLLYAAQTALVALPPAFQPTKAGKGKRANLKSR